MPKRSNAEIVVIVILARYSFLCSLMDGLPIEMIWKQPILSAVDILNGVTRTIVPYGVLLCEAASMLQKLNNF